MKCIINIFLLLIFLVSCSESGSVVDEPCDGDCGIIVEDNTNNFRIYPSNQDCPYYPEGSYHHSNSNRNCYHVRIENSCSGERKNFILFKSHDISLDAIGEEVCNYQ
jgi:hypothetical protein